MYTACVMDECVYVQRCVSVDDYLTSPIPQLDHVTCPLSDVSIRRVDLFQIIKMCPVQKICETFYNNNNNN